MGLLARGGSIQLSPKGGQGWLPNLPQTVGKIKANEGEALSVRGHSKSLFAIWLPLSTHVYSCLPVSIGGRSVYGFGQLQLGSKRGFLDVDRVLISCQ